MIEISSLTQLAQTPIATADTPRAITPVAPVEAGHKSAFQGEQEQARRDDKNSGQASGRHGNVFSLESNVIRGRETDLQFRIDKDTERLIVTMLDGDGEMIRQMPSDLILRLAERIEQIQDEGQLGLNERA